MLQRRTCASVLVLGATLLGLSVVAHLSVAADAPRAKPSDRLMTARQGACAASLPDGSILITGGKAGKTALASTEVFNVRSGAAAGAAMRSARVDHACAAIPSGAVLVAGGSLPDGGALDTAELYDPATGAWVPVGSMMMKRAKATASPLRDGRILIAGGEIGGVPTNAIEVFNPASRTFQALPQGLLSLRSQHAAAVLPSGKVLIAGGADREKPLDTIEVFDPATGIVSAAGKMTVARAGLTATVLLDGRVLLTGGSSNGKTEISSAEILDPKTGVTVLVRSMGAPRQGHMALRLPENNAVLIIGGTGNGNLIAGAELYIPWRDKYKPLASLKLPLGDGTAAQVAAALKAALSETVVNAATSDPSLFPVVSTDKDDYVPGETVTITGEGWPANTAINLHLDRQPTATGVISDWTATSDALGQFTTTYKVVEADLGVAFTLTVEVPGTDETAQILRTVRFTDGAVKVSMNPTVSGAVYFSYRMFSGSGCSGTAGPSLSDKDNFGVQANESIEFEALTVPGYTFSSWTGAAFTVVAGSNGKRICVNGFQGGNRDYVANFTATNSGTSLTVASASAIYGGATTLSAVLQKPDGSLLSGKSVSFELNGTSVGSAVTNASGVAALSNVALTGINAASYPSGVRASFAGEAGLSGSNGTAALQIAQRPITVTVDAKSKIYGDSDPALTYQITSGSLVGTDSPTGSLTRAAGENIGSYAISQGTLALNSNYNLSFVGANLTIRVRLITVTADPQSKVYGDTDPILTYKLTAGGLAQGDTFTGALSRTVGESVGTYAINQGTLALGSNYNLSFVAANLTITVRPITVTADPQSKVYGDADPALTYKITVGSLVQGDTFTGDLSRTAGESVGPYAINQGTLAPGSNYNLSFVTANLTITARPITVTADPQSKVYGDTDPILTYKLTAGSLAHGDTFTGTLSRAAAENVGTYAISQGTLALNSNYNLSFVGANLTITVRPITVTADSQSKVYGDTDPILTYKLTAGTLVQGDTFTGDLSRTAGENVGTYPINQGTLALGTNYNLSFAGANLTISARKITVTADATTKVYGNDDPQLTYKVTTGSLITGDSLTGSLSRTPGGDVGHYPITQGTLTAGSNYELTFVSADLTITPRPIIVTAKDANKIYGDLDPAFEFTLSSALVNGDSLKLVRKPGDAVGTYAIDQVSLTVGKASNYEVTITPAKLTINQRPISVAVDAKTKYYGDADPALTYKINSGTLVNNDAFTGALTRVAGESVGAYGIQQGSLTLSANYNLTFTPANLTIAQRPITVTADAQLKPYGTQDPVLTYKITSGNLVNNDAFTGAFTRVAGENVGVYLIYKGSLTAGTNYALSFVGATLTIDKAQTSTTLTSAFGPLTSATNIVLTATVGSPDGVGVQGTVKFIDLADNNVLGEIALSNAKATLTVNVGTIAGPGVILPGSHSIQAVFSGNSNLWTSQSTSLAPTSVTITAPGSGSVYPAKTLVSTFAGTYTGAGSPKARWFFDTTTASDGIVTATNVAGSYTFQAAGVYGVLLAATDGAGSIALTNNVSVSAGFELPAMIVIYDPLAGFVTGGGWINSQPGACRSVIAGCTELATGKANFGFVAKYQKGANTPSGETEFQFKAGNLDFKSTSYEWLVVSGSMAQYKGVGAIKGQTGAFKFMLTARDGDLQGTKGKDGIRMKITTSTDQVVYDNMFTISADDTNSPGNTQDLEGGSIQIHSK